MQPCPWVYQNVDLHPLRIFVFKLCNKFVTRVWGAENCHGIQFLWEIPDLGLDYLICLGTKSLSLHPKAEGKGKGRSLHEVYSAYWGPCHPCLCIPKWGTLARSLRVAKVRLWTTSSSAKIHWNVCQWHIHHWLINIVDLVLISLRFETNSLSSSCFPVLIGRNISFNYFTYLCLIIVEF